MSTAATAAFDTDCDGVWDEMDTYPCDFTVMGTAFSPAQGDHGMLMFEDKWPMRGDFDFNDVVVAYNYVYALDARGKVVRMRLTFNTLALGADYHNGAGMVLPVRAARIVGLTKTVNGVTTDIPVSTTDNMATFVISNDLREVFPNPNERINTEAHLPRQVGSVIEINVDFGHGERIDLAQAPFDFFIFRSDDPTHEIHMPEYRGTSNMDTTLFQTHRDITDWNRAFVEKSGVPFGLRFPTLTQYPSEGVSIDQLYPGIVDFGASGGQSSQNFYVAPVQAQYAYRDAAGLPAPAPTFLGPDHFPADTSCVPAWGIAVEWGTRRAIFSYGAILADNGDALVTGYTRGDSPGAPNMGGLDGFVTRFDTITGQEIWSTQIASGGDDTGRDITTDAAGNIYVTGAKSNDVSWGPWYMGQLNGISDGFVAKLDSAGNILWEQAISGPGNDSGYGVEVDSAGNVYVAGYASQQLPGAPDPGGFPSSFLAKYDANGALQWLRQYRTDPGHADNYSYSMDVGIDDAAGMVWVVGTERRYNVSPAAAANPFLAKHRTSDGALMQVVHLGGHGYWNSSTDGRLAYGINLSVDAFDGSIYATGSWVTGTNTSSWGTWNKPTGDGSADAYMVKFNPDGTEAWSYVLASNNGGSDFAEAVLSTGVGGAVYFTGRTDGAMPGFTNLGGTDYYITSLNHDGTFNWTVQDGTAARDIAHLAASVAPSQSGGNVYVIGNTDLNFGQSWEAYWNTAFHRHDVTTGAKQDMVVAQQLGWTTGQWGACSNACGAGLMTRTVQCTWSDGTPAADPSMCVRQQPFTESTCYDDSGCAVAWQTPAWTACSNTCGLGDRTRRVHCRDSNGFWRPDEDCAHLPRPADIETCGDYSTCTYSWNIGTWSACSQPSACQMGSQTRSASCLRSDGTTVPNSSCAGAAPAVSQSCGDTAACLSSASSCRALYDGGITASGRYDIYPNGPSGSPLNVYCDMSNGGFTNIDLARRRIWLNSSDYISCRNGLSQTSNSIRCDYPVFNDNPSMPLYHYLCDGSDRSADYLLDHIGRRLLGHKNSSLLGFRSLNQRHTSWTSTGNNEYCFVNGNIVRWDNPACSAYGYRGNGNCVPGYFILSL